MLTQMSSYILSAEVVVRRNTWKKTSWGPRGFDVSRHEIVCCNFPVVVCCFESCNRLPVPPRFAQESDRDCIAFAADAVYALGAGVQSA